MAHESRWWQRAAFYSIYPLGYCGAPHTNDRAAPPEHRIRKMIGDLDRIAALGFTALYLGPLFESGSHGYDTCDYFSVDRRLGTNDDLADVVRAAHDRGLRVVLDGVYNHVGRGFEAFERLRAEGRGSQYASWFRGVRFDLDNRFGDGFVYDGWEGVDELVTLDHGVPAVREHLFSAATFARERFGIDGIRLDVAYSLPLDFLAELSSRMHALDPDFFLLGEVIHGGYVEFVADGRLQSVTNYEAYKGLWSSFNDRNLHEIAYTLRRLFAEGGLLRDALSKGRLPYTFADNHDVTRVAAELHQSEHLVPLYGLVWTIPGIPSVYYGSEYGLRTRKEEGDWALRPTMERVISARESGAGHARWIEELNALRSRSKALVLGAYREVAVASASFAFERRYEGERVIVAVNADPGVTRVALPPDCHGRYECLFGGEAVEVSTAGVDVPGYGMRVIRRVA